jgi:acetyl esterase/lipase
LKHRQASPDQDQITTLSADLAQARTFDINPASPQILSAYLGTGQSAPVPLKLASGVQAPVLLIHANGDGGAPIQQSLAMRDALKASGKDVAFTDVNGSDEHPLESRETRLATLTALVDFLAKRNPAT